MTIFACATAPIKSGVAIIRVSGCNAGQAIRLITGKQSLPPRLATLCKLYNPDNAELIDEALVLWFPAPASFTGENTAEFHIHGSRAVISEMLETLDRIPGFRMAEPGEFSRRAFENGKLGLTEAEGLADLIDAETKIQAKQALRQSQGGLRILYDSWRTNLLRVLANIEAYIDFPDEEIPDNVIDNVMSAISQLKTDIVCHLDDNNRGEKLRTGLYAIIIGAPNVGKSSLVNYLAGRDIAIVSDIAGTTRDLIEVHLNLDGYPLTLVDTAGLREKAGKIEEEGIKRALARAAHADLKIAMFDASTISKLDESTLRLIDDNTIVVVNKSDLSASIANQSGLAEFSPVIISLKTNSGMEQLIERLRDIAQEYLYSSPDPVITRQRHRKLLNETVYYLGKFNLDMEIEIAAENLRSAANALGRITGCIDTEAILSEIFSNFCIGK